MITLEKTFVSGEGGYSQNPLTYTLISRTEKVALYQRTYSDGRVKDCEVFRVKILPKGTQVFKTVTVDDEEKYAITSQFGISAWSYTGKGALAAAKQKYNELCQTEDDSVNEVEKPETTFLIPVGEFSTAEFAETNNIQYPIAFLWLKEAQVTGTVKFSREERRNARGKATKLFVEVTKS